MWGNITVVQERHEVVQEYLYGKMGIETNISSRGWASCLVVSPVKLFYENTVQIAPTFSLFCIIVIYTQISLPAMCRFWSAESQLLDKLFWTNYFLNRSRTFPVAWFAILLGWLHYTSDSSGNYTFVCLIYRDSDPVCLGWDLIISISKAA